MSRLPYAAGAVSYAKKLLKGQVDWFPFLCLSYVLREEGACGERAVARAPVSSAGMPIALTGQQIEKKTSRKEKKRIFSEGSLSVLARCLLFQRNRVAESAERAAYRLKTSPSTSHSLSLFHSDVNLFSFGECRALKGREMSSDSWKRGKIRDRHANKRVINTRGSDASFSVLAVTWLLLVFSVSLYLFLFALIWLKYITPSTCPVRYSVASP